MANNRITIRISNIMKSNIETRDYRISNNRKIILELDLDTESIREKTRIKVTSNLELRRVIWIESILILRWKIIDNIKRDKAELGWRII